MSRYSAHVACSNALCIESYWKSSVGFRKKRRPGQPPQPVVGLEADDGLVCRSAVARGLQDGCELEQIPLAVVLGGEHRDEVAHIPVEELAASVRLPPLRQVARQPLLTLVRRPHGEQPRDDDPVDPVRVVRRELHGDARARAEADEVGALDRELVEDAERRGSVVRDLDVRRRRRVGHTEAGRVHRDGTEPTLGEARITSLKWIELDDVGCISKTGSPAPVSR